MAIRSTSFSGSEQRLIELLEAHIADSRLAIGSRLPTERELAGHLGLTRTAVRRGLAALEADGRISREVGRGTFLRRAGQAELPGVDSRPDDVGPADVMAVRRLVEPQVVSLVVAWATSAELDEMDRCLAGGRGARSHEEFETWDAALHRSIVAGSHSRLFMRIFAVIDGARHGPLWGDIKRRSFSRQRQDDYQRDHEILVAALRARDEEGAARAMRSHLLRVERNMLGARGHDTGPEAPGS